MKSIVTIILFASFLACSDWPAPLCEGDQYTLWSIVDGHDVNAVEVDGILVDAPVGFDVTRLIDIIDQVDECLANIGDLPKDEAEAAFCPHQAYHYTPIRRECFETKVETDWHYSRDGKYQMLWDTADRWYCRNKGLDDERECYWRAGIQHGFQIVTPPDLQFFGDMLVRWSSMCESPYSSKQLAYCAGLSLESRDA